MRISDLLWMAVKTLKRRLMVLPAAAIAISAFCLCFAGAVMVTVQQEKSLPYELEVSADTAKLSENTFAAISGIPHVAAVTPVLEVPASIVTGGYKAQLTLTGIDASYINESFDLGGEFPDSSAMPYIVLNDAACRMFRDEKSSENNAQETETPPIDWLNAAVSVQMSEGVKPVVSKIVGLLSGDDKDRKPVAYISVACAKALLSRDGQSADDMSAKVRVENVGCAATVSAQIKVMGLSFLNANEVSEMKWNSELGEMSYLIVIGLLGLYFGAVFSDDRRKAEVLEQQHSYSALEWIGMKKRDIKKLFILQSLLTAVIGVIVGIIVSVSVPSFLAPEAADTSIFAMQVPIEVVALSAVICAATGMLPFLSHKKL